MRPDANRTFRNEYSRTATSENIETTMARGRALWHSIYEPHADKLHDKLGSYHPDFIGRHNLFKKNPTRSLALPPDLDLGFIE
jgi:hypothetical protein